ncbi:hypothetical protein Tco_0710473 [Tanacetum coccineum]
MGVGWRVGVTILPLLIEVKPPCFFTETETEYLTKRIQDGRPDVVQVTFKYHMFDECQRRIMKYGEMLRFWLDGLVPTKVLDESPIVVLGSKALEDVLGHSETFGSIDASEGVETNGMSSQGNNDHV